MQWALRRVAWSWDCNPDRLRLIAGRRKIRDEFELLAAFGKRSVVAFGRLPVMQEGARGLVKTGWFCRSFGHLFYYTLRRSENHVSLREGTR